VYAVCETGK